MRQARLINKWAFEGLEDGEASNMRVERLDSEGVGVWMFDLNLIGYLHEPTDTIHLYQGWRSIRPRSDTVQNRILQLVEVVADEIHEDARPHWSDSQADEVYFDHERDELPDDPSQAWKPERLFQEKDTLDKSMDSTRFNVKT